MTDKEMMDRDRRWVAEQLKENGLTKPTVEQLAMGLLPCIWDFTDKENIQVTHKSLSRALKYLIELGDISINEVDLSTGYGIKPEQPKP